jgi:serine protease Do
VYHSTKKIISGKQLAAVLFLFALTQLAHAGETFKHLQKELHQIIDSSKVNVVTVSARFSHEVNVNKDSGLLSFFKSEYSKKALTYTNIGTGIIYNDQGYIITRSSIVWGSAASSVTLFDGRERPARLIGHDPETGFAVLKIDPENFKTIKIGNSADVQPGSWIVTIGNSYGAFPSVALGFINGVRSDELLQVSANLSLGNNGSPVFSLKGEVIGVIAGRLSAWQLTPELTEWEINNCPFFAYPIELVKKVTDDIIQFGYVRKGWLGVVGYHDGSQPKISKIKDRSPAQQAGLVEGDVIVKYSSKSVNSIADLVRMVEYSPPGKSVPVEFMRAGQIRKVEIAIGEKSQKLVAAEAPSESESETLTPPFNQELPQDYQPTFFQTNKLLETRIAQLEKEVERLKKLLESK